MSNSNGKERRRQLRVQVSLPVSVLVETRPTESVGTVFNLSESGAFVRTARQVERGSAISLRFEDGVIDPPQVQGRVVRVDDMAGIGIEVEGNHEGLRSVVRKLLATARELHARLDEPE